MHIIQTGKLEVIFKIHKIKKQIFKQLLLLLAKNSYLWENVTKETNKLCNRLLLFLFEMLRENIAANLGIRILS